MATQFEPVNLLPLMALDTFLAQARAMSGPPFLMAFMAPTARVLALHAAPSGKTYLFTRETSVDISGLTDTEATKAFDGIKDHARATYVLRDGMGLFVELYTGTYKLHADGAVEFIDSRHPPGHSTEERANNPYYVAMERQQRQLTEFVQEVIILEHDAPEVRRSPPDDAFDLALFAALAKATDAFRDLVLAGRALVDHPENVGYPLAMAISPAMVDGATMALEFASTAGLLARLMRPEFKAKYAACTTDLARARFFGEQRAAFLAEQDEEEEEDDPVD